MTGNKEIIRKLIKQNKIDIDEFKLSAKKYLERFTETKSMSKIEKIIEKENIPSLEAASSLYFLISDKNVSPSKKRLYNSQMKLKKYLESETFLEVDNKFKSLNTEYYKTIKNIYSLHLNKKNEKDFVESFRKKMIEVKKQNDFSFSDLNELIFDSKIDRSNIYHFVVNKQDHKIGKDKLYESVGKLNEWFKQARNF